MIYAKYQMLQHLFFLYVFVLIKLNRILLKITKFLEFFWESLIHNQPPWDPVWDWNGFGLVMPECADVCVDTLSTADLLSQ